jgi:nitrate/TMAO reductase-like tetraheme cytochrome c subunit
MKLKLLILACFAAVCSVHAAGSLFARQAPSQKLPGDDVIIPSVDEKWGPCKFTHQRHLAFSSCLYCHHTSEGLTLESFNAGEAAKVPLCADCHVRKEGEAKTPKSADGTELWSKEAYHLNCIDCHKGEITKKPKGITEADIKKQGEGPTKCADCHEKKE